MLDLDHGDGVKADLVKDLRARARLMRWIAVGFVLAIVAVIAAAIYYYIQAPNIAQQEANTRFNLARQSLAAEYDARIESLTNDAFTLRNEVAARLASDLTRIEEHEFTEDLRAVTFADAQTGWAVGWSGTILATRDGGATWDSQDSPTAETLLAATFADAQTGWAVGVSGTILATRDGGATWDSQDSPTAEHLYAVTFTDAQTGWAVGAGGTILATRDGGANWDSQDSPTAETLLAVTFADAQTGWAVGAGGTILATRDGGATWDSQDSPTSETLFAVTSADAQTGWAVGVSGTILAFNAPDLSFLGEAATLADLREALERAEPEFGVDLQADLNRIISIEAQVRALETEKANLPKAEDAATATNTPEDTTSQSVLASLVRAGTIESWAQRIGVILLLMFLVAIFSTLYRYSLRMAAFYDGRAEALLLDWLEESGHSLAELTAIFGPEAIDFARARSPSDHAFALAQSAVDAVGKKG